MTSQPPSQNSLVEQRVAIAAQNLLKRLPAANSASRLQAQRILQTVGSLSILEWRVLWDVYASGPLSIRDLALLQRTDHSQLSRALPAMQSKGLITMSKDAHDGRQTRVDLTPEGRAAYLHAAPAMKQRRDRLAEAFTQEELAQFIALFDRLDAFLQLPADRIAAGQATTPAPDLASAGDAAGTQD